MGPWFCRWHKRKSRVVFSAGSPASRTRFRRFLIAGACLLFAPFGMAQTQLSSGVVEQGEDYAVYQRVSAVTGATGAVTVQTNQFTLLENMGERGCVLFLLRLV